MVAKAPSQFGDDPGSENADDAGPEDAVEFTHNWVGKFLRELSTLLIENPLYGACSVDICRAAAVRILTLIEGCRGHKFDFAVFSLSADRPVEVLGKYYPNFHLAVYEQSTGVRMALVSSIQWAGKPSEFQQVMAANATFFNPSSFAPPIDATNLPKLRHCILEIMQIPDGDAKKTLDWLRAAVQNEAHRASRIQSPEPANQDNRESKSAAWSPANGWAFQPGMAAYNGTAIRVTGIKWNLLKAMVEAEGPLTVDDLKFAGWAHDEEPETSTIRTHLSQLRALLRRRLGFDDDPIPACDRGELLAWQLHPNLR